MWATTSIWFDLFIFSVFLLFGQILFGHFEERTPVWRKLLKTAILLLVLTGITILFGRTAAFAVLGLSLIPLFVVHGILLPKKGINGWTGEPKALYYEFRGWDKDIFKVKPKN